MTRRRARIGRLAFRIGAVVGLVLGLSVATVAGQDKPPARPDSTGTPGGTLVGATGGVTGAAGGSALPDADRPAFALPDVVVRGEDLTRIAGGERVKSDDAPGLRAPPTETPRNLPAPELSMSWRRIRPFVLQPAAPPSRSAPPKWARIAMRSEPGLYGSLITGGPEDPNGSSAWRLQVDGAWIDEPVSGTERQHTSVRLDRARGHWSDRPQWAFTVNGVVRRLDWDLEQLPVGGSQAFAGVRGGLRSAFGGSAAGLRAELAQFTPHGGGDETRWVAAEAQFDAGPTSRHVFLRPPAASLRVGGLFGDVPSGEASRRSWGEASLGFHAVRRGTVTLWIGAQGQWDGGRGVVGPKVLARWGRPAEGWMLWSRVETALALDPWFEEGAARDFALVDLGRAATLSVPALSFGGNAMVSGWTLAASASAKRLRSPRTWHEEEASGLFRPVSASSRWVAEADLGCGSPPGRPVRLEVSAGFFDDGDGERLTFRPVAHAHSALRARLGAYTAAVEVEARGRTWATGSRRLPGALLAHLELGRFIGRAGRLWVRWQNVTDDPAPVWPFVDSARSAVHLGWDIHPATASAAGRGGTPG